MDAPRGPCAAGYYCTVNSTTDRPSGPSGNQCQPGYHCVEGSWMEDPCPPGYFLPSPRAKNITYCLLCTAGKFCNISGLPQPQGFCSPGFYCPEGQTVPDPNEYPCPLGYFCVEGSPSPQICPSGTYQDEMRSSACKECPAGFYCDNALAAVVNYTLFECPEGYYCPNGTRSATQYACPAGTFNNHTGLRWEEECLPCTGGFYCPGSAVVSPDLPCSAGYYCKQGGRTATPVQGQYADPCPVGHYCPEQTAEPIKCPVGTFSNNTKLRNETDCIQCTRGFYCDVLGLTEPTGPCSPGFYCHEGSPSDTQIICPQGNYCPLATHTPYRCPNRTWSNATRLASSAECTPCPAGWYCQQNGLTMPEGLCQQGYYCPEGSELPNSVVCPIGLHCPEGSAEPLSCQSGNFTNRTGMWECEICPDRFFCLPENVTAGDPQSGYHDCPPGYYCPSGTGLNWLPCPKGTYSNQLNLFRVEQCRDCDGGFYCSEESATNVTGLCAAGFYCESGIDRPSPNNAETNSTYPPSCPLLGGHTGYGDICPRGFYCPVGSSLPLSCEAGTYQNQEGQSSCMPCPEGYYCLANSTDYTDKTCPSGHYCPLSTSRSDEYPCPSGSFNPLGGQTNETACKACTPGLYCLGNGLSLPTSNCSEGWYCSGGSTQPMPTNHAEGGKCYPGTFCPGGSDAPTNCTEGYYCATERLATPTANCTQDKFTSHKFSFQFSSLCPEWTAVPGIG
ncbi:hypothetical protein LSAT2_020568 [Lamellibrachia satsuma]|nr:hypothetical protein LSAT2_020568 [Lamellibrachia satsuma]